MNAERPHERPICGAKNRAGNPCQRSPMPNGRCNLHGGKSLVGPAAPGHIHGRHSKYLPTGLAEKYRQGLTDPDLLSHRADLALIDAKIFDLLAAGDMPDAAYWQQIRQAVGQADKALYGYAPPEYLALSALLHQGAANETRWAEVATWLDLRRKTADGERKRLVALQQMITVEQAMALIAQVVEVVNEYVTDRDTLAAIGSEVRAVLSRRRSIEHVPGSGSDAPEATG
jgi:hypothetical protein